MELNKDDIEPLMYGATFLGSGGGGSLKTGGSFAQQIKESLGDKTIRLYEVNEVSDNEWFCVTGAVGSPDALEKTTNLIDFVQQSIRLLQKEKEVSIQGILSIETGVNMLIALLASIKLELPLVNGDGAGRAVPSMEMLTYPTDSISPLTLVCASPPAEVLFMLKNSNPSSKERISYKADVSLGTTLYAKTPAEMEILTRPIISEPIYGQIASLSMWALNGKTVKFPQTMVKNTYQITLDVGRIIYECIVRKKNPVEDILAYYHKENAFLIASGVIKNIDNGSKGGFDWGKITIEESKRKVYLIYQNETLIAWDDQSTSPIAMAPDLICYITDSAIPYTNADDLKEGMRLNIIGIKANELLRAKTDIFLSNLKSLGYYGKYQPIENITR